MDGGQSRVLDVGVTFVAPERKVRERRGDPVSRPLVVFGGVAFDVPRTEDGATLEAEPILLAIIAHGARRLRGEVKTNRLNARRGK